MLDLDVGDDGRGLSATPPGIANPTTAMISSEAFVAAMVREYRNSPCRQPPSKEAHPQNEQHVAEDGPCDLMP